jgi:hypothetical protein
MLAGMPVEALPGDVARRDGAARQEEPPDALDFPKAKTGAGEQRPYVATIGNNKRELDHLRHGAALRKQRKQHGRSFYAGWASGAAVSSISALHSMVIPRRTLAETAQRSSWCSSALSTLARLSFGTLIW